MQAEITLRQAAQQALEALEGLADYRYTDRVKNTMTALRAALAEPEQPVEYVRDEDNPCYMFTAATSQPEQEPQTTHWEGCEAVHPECRKPKQEPMATKQMLRWVEHLKRLSDDGQHMSIPGLSSGACWELAIELEQFIKNTAPTPRKPLTYDELEPLCEAFDSYDTTQNELVEFARAIERTHGITGDSNE